MSATKTLSDWLAECGCHDIKSCVVTIGRESWTACHYHKTLEYTAGMDCVRDGRHKAGETYDDESIYCLGNLPAEYQGNKRAVHPCGKVCFPLNGLDWYVCAYMPSKNLTPGNTEFHPFGVSFMLKPWNIPGSTVDQYEPKKYLRQPLTVAYS